MEEWLEARTDITPNTKKGYRAYLKGFRKHFSEDPKEASVEDVFLALDKLTISCKTKVLNMLSQYTGLSEEYGKKIRQLNKISMKEQNERRPVIQLTKEEILKKVKEDPNMPSDLLVIYYLLTHFQPLRLQDYHSLEIGVCSTKTSNWINKSWTKIRWNTPNNNQPSFVMKLPESFKTFRYMFETKTRLTERNFPALLMALGKKNKELGIPRGISIFKQLIINENLISNE